MMKTTIIENFNSRNEAFDWVISKMQNGIVGDITTDSQYRGIDAIIGECEEFTYVGLYNTELC